MANRASSGSHLLGPNLPARAYSEPLESSFECLHRLVCNNLSPPESISSAFLFVRYGNQYFYEIRELLEQDFGISSTVARRLPIPMDGPFLKKCHSYSESEQGEALHQELLLRNDNSTDEAMLASVQLDGSSNFWTTLGQTVFKFTRCLRITQNQVFPWAPAEHKEGYRFPWLEDSKVDFEDPVNFLNSIFFPLPEKWGLRGDPFLWVDLARRAAHLSRYEIGSGVAQWLQGEFLSLTGHPLTPSGDIFVSRYDCGGMSSGFISLDWWFDEGQKILLDRTA